MEFTACIASYARGSAGIIENFIRHKCKGQVHLAASRTCCLIDDVRHMGGLQPRLQFKSALTDFGMQPYNPSLPF